MGSHQKDRRRIDRYRQAQPGSKGGSKRDGNGARDVSGGKFWERPSVDQRGARPKLTAEFLNREQTEVRQHRAVQSGSPLIDRSKPTEIGRITAEPPEERPDKRAFIRRRHQRVHLALLPPR